VARRLSSSAAVGGFGGRSTTSGRTGHSLGPRGSCYEAFHALDLVENSTTSEAHVDSSCASRSAMALSLLNSRRAMRGLKMTNSIMRPSRADRH
jgi:hypothetical protein